MIKSNIQNIHKKERKAQLENSIMYGEYYTGIYMKSEQDEKSDEIFRLIEIEKSIPCALRKADLICRKETWSQQIPSSIVQELLIMN